MRIFAAATILLLSSSVGPALAEEAGNAAGSSQPLTVPVQPERNPQQSEQSREQDRQRADDVRIGPGWRAEERQAGPQTNDRGRMTDDQDRDHRTVGRGWRMGRDNDERGYRDDDRPRRQVKICFEYENGDEYCHYRR
jgi:hypothetical protein